MRSNYLFTSESVSEGHPDKVADQITDAIVDLFLSKDPEARVACETLVTTQRIVLGGEIRCKGVYRRELYADTTAGRRASRDEIEQVVRADGQADRLRAGRLPLADRRASRTTCTASRRTSPRASTPAATRTKAPATRASCSASPATRRPT